MGRNSFTAVFFWVVFCLLTSLSQAQSLLSLAQVVSFEIPPPISGLQRYDPAKACRGYTLFSPATADAGPGQRARLVSMEGEIVHEWPITGFPAKLLPGGSLIGSSGRRLADFQDTLDLVQLDWSGKKTEWAFHQWDLVHDFGREAEWIARQHHDFEREGNPVGYFAPGMEPLVHGGRTLVLAHKDVDNPSVSLKTLKDDVIYEVDAQGRLLDPAQGGFLWLASDHFEEMGFDEEAKEAIFEARSAMTLGQPTFDWLHTNSLSLVGPNRWYEQGDERFHPENLIIDSRQANFIAIIDRKSGRIVWRLGPDFSGVGLGQLIGQHHAHIIPKGLPGEGNMLVFDNGGAAGYGKLLPSLPPLSPNELRFYSRVIEFNPITLEKVWEYSHEQGSVLPLSGDEHRFFSFYISSAQRLPNGNTLIAEGDMGRMFEVTPSGEVVWEYVSPYSSLNLNAVYRAYRVPAAWLKDGSGRMLTGLDGKPLIDPYANEPQSDPWR